MNKSGGILILSSIVLSSAVTYILTKAHYTKGFSKAPKAEPKPKNLKKLEEIPLQTKPQTTMEKENITKYAESFRKEYAPDPAEHPVREYINEDIFNTEDDDFEKIGFTLYADGILADGENNVVFDREDNVGIEACEKFDELERNGAVYVRNYELGYDYEILRDLRTYDEVLRSSRKYGKS